MKRTRRIASLLVAVLMCLSLCGCQALDDMRAVHAVWQKDGSILWNGDVYRKLKGISDEIQPFYSVSSLRITETDVPVLLSDWFGISADISEDGTLLCAWHGDGGYALYCHEDYYDEISSYLQEEIRFDCYFYSYWMDDGDLVYYYLTEDQRQVVDQLFLTEKPLSSAVEDYDFILPIESCDEKHLFSGGYMFDIAVKEDCYYLIAEEHIYMVPSAHNAVFKKIVKAFYENEVAYKFA